MELVLVCIFAKDAKNITDTQTHTHGGVRRFARAFILEIRALHEVKHLQK